MSHKEYYPLIFPDQCKDKIDWAGTAKKIIAHDPMIYDSFKELLEAEINDNLKTDQPKVSLERDVVVEKYAQYKKNRVQELVGYYIKEGFNCDLLAWKEGEIPSYMLFDTIFNNDLIKWSKNPKIKKYLSASSKPEKGNHFDPDLMEGSMLFITEVFNNKFIDFKYDGDPVNPKSKEDLLKEVAENGLAMSDSQIFSMFVNALIQGAVAKKKTLTPSVE